MSSNTESIGVPANWRTKVAIKVPEAGPLAGGLCGKAPYAAAARGHIPTIRLGRRIVVSVAALRRLLGQDPT